MKEGLAAGCVTAALVRVMMSKMSEAMAVDDLGT